MQETQAKVKLPKVGFVEEYLICKRYQASMCEFDYILAC